MCFSAPVSFIAGGTIGIVGGMTIKKARSKSELPLASIPLLFGVEQIIEGFLWLSLNTPVCKTIFMYGFLSLSYTLWPFYAPMAVLLVETEKTRRILLKILLAIGIALSLYSLFFYSTMPIVVNVIQNSIAYDSVKYVPYQIILIILYLIAVPICFLISSHSILKVFGIALLASSVIAFKIEASTFASVWCFFAAFLSIIIYFHFRQKEKAPLKVMEKSAL